MGLPQGHQEANPFVEEYRMFLLDSVKALSMIDEDDGVADALDYVLPLMASACPTTTVAFMRPITQKLEFEVMQSFAKDARTEFDQVNRAMEKCFGVHNIKRHVCKGEEGTKGYWEQVSYEEKPFRSFDSLSAPCHDEKRIRANTLDTFEHFFHVYEVPKGSRIALASTALYGPYQTIGLINTAIRHQVRLYFTGCEYKPYKQKLLATLCLQDLKSAVEAMHRFVE